MPQKQKQRPSPLDEPPTASSSDSEEEEEQPPSSLRHEEDEVSSGEEEEDASSGEEEEDDDLPPPLPKNPLPLPTSPHPLPSSSESETESGSGSETESEPEPTPAKVKPLASKPMDQAPKPKAQPSPAPPKSASKRPAENNNANAQVAKKKKAADSSSSAAVAAPPSDEDMEEDGKKSGDQLKKSQKSQRLWSGEDELAILKGLVEFSSTTGQDPLKFTNAVAFHDFVKKSLHAEVSSNQLKEKVRRLKKKFETLAEKGKSEEGLKFFRQHDQKAFELSKKVWGSELGGVGANGSLEKPKSNGNAAKSPKKETSGKTGASAKKLKAEGKPELGLVPVVSLGGKESEKMKIDQKLDDASLIFHEVSRFKEGLSVYGLNEDGVKRGLELIGESKRAELRGKWKKLQLAEMELFANRAELIAEQTKLIVDALRSSKQ